MSDFQSTTTLSRKYAKLGAYTGRQVSPLHALRIFIFGRGGEGKSAFIQSNPNCFIINCDLSGSTSPDPVASVWPPIDSVTGRPLISPMGDPIPEMKGFKYEDIKRTVNTLKEMAIAGEDRPLTVAIDSLTQLIEMVKDWVVANARQLNLVGEGTVVTDFSQLRGEAAWDRVYAEIVGLLDDLKQHGYGYILVGHSTEKQIPIADKQVILKPSLVMGPGLWARLQPRIDMSALIKMGTKTIVNVVTETGTNGKPNVKRVPQTVQVCTFDLEDVLFAGVTKRRLAEMMTKIELPPKGSWGVVEAAYNEAVRKYMGA